MNKFNLVSTGQNYRPEYNIKYVISCAYNCGLQKTLKKYSSFKSGKVDDILPIQKLTAHFFFLYAAAVEKLQKKPIELILSRNPSSAKVDV